MRITLSRIKEMKQKGERISIFLSGNPIQSRKNATLRSTEALQKVLQLFQNAAG